MRNNQQFQRVLFKHSEAVSPTANQQAAPAPAAAALNLQLVLLVFLSAWVEANGTLLHIKAAHCGSVRTSFGGCYVRRGNEMQKGLKADKGRKFA